MIKVFVTAAAGVPKSVLFSIEGVVLPLAIETPLPCTSISGKGVFVSKVMTGPDTLIFLMSMPD